jgi:antitoxin (DNA-binding transcriptional repressor) of toxin-antitoxin stability system
MVQVTPDEAATRLSDLIARAGRGEAIIIVSGGQAVQLVPIAVPGVAPLKRCFGSAAGQIQMAPDFDAPLADFVPATQAEERTEDEWLGEVERRARAALAGSPGVSREAALAELNRRRMARR